MLSQLELQRQLSCDPLTGEFTRLVKTSWNADVGDKAGNIVANGYWQVSVNNKAYLAHRLVWFYFKGYWPKEMLDHVDGNKLNNALSNLREATRSQNMRNVRLMKTNTSGFKGVSWSNAAKKWQVRCKVLGKDNYLGLFESAEEASQAYETFASKHHGEFYKSTQSSGV